MYGYKMGISSNVLKAGFWILTTVGLLGVITVERHYTVDMLATLIIAILMISVNQHSLTKPNWVIRFIEEQHKFEDQIAKNVNFTVDRRRFSLDK